MSGMFNIPLIHHGNLIGLKGAEVDSIRSKLTLLHLFQVPVITSIYQSQREAHLVIKAKLIVNHGGFRSIG